MELVCKPYLEIVLMITAYYIGYVFGGLAYAMPDLYGRKKTLILSLLLSCFAQTCMILSHSLNVRSVMFFLMGLG